MDVFVFVCVCLSVCSHCVLKSQYEVNITITHNPEVFCCAVWKCVQKVSIFTSLQKVSFVICSFQKFPNTITFAIEPEYCAISDD